MRGQVKESEETAGILTKLLHNQDSDVALAAASGFGIIMSDHSDILHPQYTFAESRFLQKQRFFSSNVKNLVKSVGSEAGDDGPTLLAVSHLVKHVPSAVMVGKAQELMPIILRAMETQENKSVALAALNTASVLIKDAPDVAQRFLREMVPRILKLTQFKGAMTVRIAALDCIGGLESFPFEVIYPFHKTIIKGLAPALDDHKRKVRREAARVRNAWYLKIEE